jgi:hemerythrin superfamily protein
MPSKKSSRKSVRKAAAKSSRRAGTPSDAIAMLKADHRKVEGLFAKFEKARGESVKEGLVEQICTELIVHTTLEEEVFYPACRSEDVEEGMMDEAQVEHDGAKILIRDLMREEPGSEMYDAKVKVLSEYIKHHVKEEERPGSGVFASAKKNGLDTKAVGAQMAMRKKELMADAETGNLPKPEPKSFSLGEDLATLSRSPGMRRNEPRLDV